MKVSSLMFSFSIVDNMEMPTYGIHLGTLVSLLCSMFHDAEDYIDLSLS